jgi:predicted lipoprotein with Yx(FWY)xxD motif
MASAGRTDEGGHGAGSREDPGGWNVERVPAGGAGRVWGRAVAGALSAAGLAAAALSLALVLAAPAASAGATTTTGKTVKVSTAKVAGVGTVLTTSSGLTLYRFSKDSPGMSTCTGACASIWPPLLAAKGTHVSGPHGVKGLSLLKVGNGHFQVAFDKLPLYRFTGDKKKGQAHGQNVEGSWFAVLKSGVPASAVTAVPAAPTTTAPGSSTTQPVTSTTQAPHSNASTGANPTMPTPATTPAPAPAPATQPTTPVTSAPAAPAPPTTTPTTSAPPTTTPTTSVGGGGYGY